MTKREKDDIAKLRRALQAAEAALLKGGHLPSLPSGCDACRALYHVRLGLGSGLEVVPS